MRLINKKHRFTFLLFFLLAGGCGEDRSREDQVGDSENPFKVQMDAVRKAKEVEQLLHVQAEQRNQLIEDQIKR